jgi:hypothetical protein
MAARSSMVVGHVRSASVPCHSHPVVMQVDDQLVALRSWTSNPGQNPLSLAHVRALLCVLDELLHLPLALGSATDTLLDGFLVLADASGSFLAALLALRQYASDLRAAATPPRSPPPRASRGSSARSSNSSPPPWSARQRGAPAAGPAFHRPRRWRGRWPRPSTTSPWRRRPSSSRSAHSPTPPRQQARRRPPPRPNPRSR